MIYRVNAYFFLQAFAAGAFDLIMENKITSE